MTALVLRTIAATCLAALLATPRAAHSRPAPTPDRLARPASVSVQDIARRLDVNRVGLAISNLGSLGYDLVNGNAGLWYPAGSDNTLMFASGLWLGAMVNGELRVAVADYSPEFRPGPMAGGLPTDPGAPEQRVWKVKRWTGDPQDSAHVERAPGGLSVDVLVHDSWSAYVAEAVPYGAPWKLHRLPDTSTPDPTDSVDVPGPDVLGDLMTWCLFNDADPNAHTSMLTAPLGAEVEQVVFGFDEPGLLGDVAFVRWRVRNRGAATWDGLRAGFWADPDLGIPGDDKVGCDSTRSLGIAYNGQPTDGIYGSAPPVLGMAFLGSSPGPLPGMTDRMFAFTSYLNGTDPTGAAQVFNQLSGLLPDGSDLLDPDGNPTRYQYSGDPLFGTGWLDPFAADQRMLGSLFPRTLAPGDSLELWAALVVAPGQDIVQALGTIGCRADYAAAAFAAGFARPFPPSLPCEAPKNCPRPASYWATQCGGGGGYTLPDLAALAAKVDARSATLDLGADPRAGLCAVLGGSGDVRAQALREYAGFLANVCATGTTLQPQGQAPVVLMSPTPVGCPDIPALDVGQLAATAASNRTVSGTYQNLVMTNRRALEGVDAGLSGFNGGAGAMYDFFGSTLDPATFPDSFPPLVRVYFDHTQTQLAYRYLRYEQLDGTAPAIGRVYAYAGFVEVPFTVRDVATGEALDVGFSERTFTDEAGTPLAPEFQPPSCDATWGPTDAADGGREYLFVSPRFYTGEPRFAYALDGACFTGQLPWLYALWSRLRSPGDAIDDGDAFDFGFGYAITPGVDAILRDLAGQPLSDPAVSAAYAGIANCLGAINRAEGVGPTCDDPTPALVSLVSAEAEPGLVRVEWRVSLEGPALVERRVGEGEWAERARLAPDGIGRVTLEDRDVEAGTRYAYRIQLASGPAGEVSIEVPLAHRLALAGFLPNPATGPLSITFSLATPAPARLELLDVAGRRVWSRVVERPVPGQQVLPLGDVRLAPGVYVLRLEQGSERRVARGVVLR